MKRSEILKLITDIVKDYTICEYDTDQWIARQILDMVEEKGMQPPKNHNKYDPVPTVTPTGHHDYSFIREWEEE